MYGFFYRLGTWLLQKVGAAVVIVVLSLAGMGLWLYARDRVDVETRRQEYIAQMQRSRAELEQSRLQSVALIATLQQGLAQQEERIATADRIIANLHALESRWERWFGNAEQQEANARQIQRMEALKLESSTSIEGLTRDLQQAKLRVEDLEFQVSSIDKDLAGNAHSEWIISVYARSAWHRSKAYLVLALAGYFVGPSVVKLLAFFVCAPWMSRGRPIRFESDLVAMPKVRPSGSTTEVILWPGEVLRLKPKYLQAGDDRLRRKSLWVFDWAIPLSSALCGLIRMVELRNGHAGERVALSVGDSAHPSIELAVIEVPDGGSLILRPGFLVGVITAGEDKVEIRRRWTLLRWQAWITLQFRFFEFVGPCRLIVVGNRSVRSETLQAEEGQTRSARRTNQWATIGFTPTLDYLPVRAETFWGYFWDANPLFDDLFAGTGLFVLQDATPAPDQNRFVRFWVRVWSAVLKVFGI